MIYTDSESVNKFQSFKVYIIKIGSLGGALEQNDQKHENCSRAPPSEPILMTYTFKDWNLFTDSESVYIEGHKRSNLGQIGRVIRNLSDIHIDIL